MQDQTPQTVANMRQFDLTVPVKAYTESELAAADRELVNAARQATHRSYAPYSRFSVGAAIRLEDGTVVTGSNQENAAYPSGTCAERTAAYYAHSAHPDSPFAAIAIAARGTDGEPTPQPISPCGACRQALLEYETMAGHPVRVLLAGAGEIYEFPSVASLLPFCFSSFD